MSQGRRWAHDGTTVVTRRGTKVYCRCGKQSPMFVGTDRAEVAIQWYSDHVGIKEVTNRRRW